MKAIILAVVVSRRLSSLAKNKSNPNIVLFGLILP